MAPFFAGASQSAPVLSSTSLPIDKGSNDSVTKKYQTVQVIIIHRHGDRTPITPLLDEDFWLSTLVAKETKAKVEEGTRILRKDDNDDGRRS